MTELQSTAVPLNAYVEKGAAYFEWLRTDVLAHVPPAARRVLSIGCGSGVTEAELVKRGLEVVGIELDPKAAQRARSRGLTVFGGDATQIASELAGRTFDCLIYADVLEHMADPVAVLRSHVALLEQGGTVIISVPNFRHCSVLWQLFVRGHVRYTDAGILDRTHLRLTTRRMVVEWLRQSEINPTTTQYGMSQRREKLVSVCSLGLLREFVARQVMIVGEKS